jgi:hypothetical protein
MARLTPRLPNVPLTSPMGMAVSVAIGGACIAGGYVLGRYVMPKASRLVLGRFNALKAAINRATLPPGSITLNQEEIAMYVDQFLAAADEKEAVRDAAKRAAVHA